MADNRAEIERLLGPAFDKTTDSERIGQLEQAVIDIDNADTGELAEIRAALVELAEIVMGG